MSNRIACCPARQDNPTPKRSVAVPAPKINKNRVARHFPVPLANAMIGEGTDYADLKIVDELNAEEYGVAFRKGSDAAAAVDEAFDALKADGTLSALAEKYELALAD